MRLLPSRKYDAWYNSAKVERVYYKLRLLFEKLSYIIIVSFEKLNHQLAISNPQKSLTSTSYLLTEITV
jgi:hypothetical protein